MRRRVRRGVEGEEERRLGVLMAISHSPAKERQGSPPIIYQSQRSELAR